MEEKWVVSKIMQLARKDYWLSVTGADQTQQNGKETMDWVTCWMDIYTAAKIVQNISNVLAAWWIENLRQPRR
jgi:hypothetical protein